MSIAISSGHSKHVRGASDELDEVNEARRVVDRIGELLLSRDMDVSTFHDDTSTTQSSNLDRICKFHNSCTRKLDISVHFNAYVECEGPMGTEVLYVTQDKLAEKLSAAISEAGTFINRGAKYRNDLKFLNGTEEPAVLIEVCFVDSEADAALYRKNFDDICQTIADTLIEHLSPKQDVPPTPSGTWQRNIETTMFGGEDDPNDSAYPPYEFIDDNVLGAALPYRFGSIRSKLLVRNINTGKQVIVDIVDIGPWMTDDEYWTTETRPMAETCYAESRPLPSGPNAGKVPSNGAGLDITPAAARAIGLEGKGTCDWVFIK